MLILYYESLKSSYAATIVSCGDGGKAVDGGATGGGDPVENQAPPVGDLVAMGVRQLVEDAVGAQQAKFAADGSRTAPSLGFGRGWGSIQQALQIPIAQAVEGELAPVDRFQQSVIVRIK